jgi:hypothetical protein
LDRKFGKWAQGNNKPFSIYEVPELGLGLGLLDAILILFTGGNLAAQSTSPGKEHSEALQVCLLVEMSSCLALVAWLAMI